MGRPVLVVAAHPDDEVLGVGGTIARHAQDGDTVHILILAEGATSRDDARDQGGRADELEALRQAARAAAVCLGAQPPRFAGLPDNRMDGLALLDVVKIVEAVVGEIQPAIIYTHHCGDLNVDHQVTHRAVVTAARPLPGCPVTAVYTFETASSTEWQGLTSQPAFAPQLSVDIAAHWPAKRAALEAYAGEMRPFPHARSIEAVEAQARLRGAQVGREAAECFMVVREIRA